MQPAIGEIRMFAGNFAPRSWALCQGQLLPISQNQALFSILGTTYGGDGRTTFGLPDLRGRFAIGEGTGPGLTPRALGAKSGTQTNTLNQNQLAPHSHIVIASNPVTSMPVSIDAPDENAPAGAYLTQQSNEFYAGSATAGQNLGGVTASAGATIGNTGAATPVNNLSPYTVLNYIICLQGVFPSRN